MIESDEPVHDFFGLSYASYLVLPRLVMQSMPVEWQRQMVALLEEAGRRFGDHYEANDYDVKLVCGERPEGDDEEPVYRYDWLSDYRRGRARLLEATQSEGQP